MTEDSKLVREMVVEKSSQTMPFNFGSSRNLVGDQKPISYSGEKAQIRFDRVIGWHSF